MAGHTSEGSLRRKPKGESPYWVRGHGGCLQLRVMRPGKTAEDKRIGAWRGVPGSDPPPSTPEGEMAVSRLIGVCLYEDRGERHEKPSGKTCPPIQQGGNAQRPQESGQAWLSETQDTFLKTISTLMMRGSGAEQRFGPVRRKHQTGHTEGHPSSDGRYLLSQYHSGRFRDCWLVFRVAALLKRPDAGRNTVLRSTGDTT